MLQGGDASRKLPACSQCHGTPLTGARRQSWPVGRPAAYMSAQLGAWRAGQRKACKRQTCISEMAKSLTQADINAAWRGLLRQPIPSSSTSISGVADATATRARCGCHCRSCAVSFGRADCFRPARGRGGQRWWRASSATSALPANTDKFAVTATQIERGEYLACIGNCRAATLNAAANLAPAAARWIRLWRGTVWQNLTPGSRYRHW